LYREDVAATVAGKAFDELYSYDGMNQLIDMQRGTLGANKASIISQYKNWEEQFTFDATGNFANYKQDQNGSGSWSLNHTRTHSKANEILTVAGSTSYVANDKNGNMIKVSKPDNWSAAYTLVYDAWNRLVQVKDGATTVATYGHNGLNHRVKKVVGSETRLFYYNRQWQCLEEYVGSTCNVRFVWGLRYVDDLVTYRNGSTDDYVLQDANWNVVALTNAAGVVQERYTYASFGKLNVFDTSFTPKSASTFNLTRSFTGQVIDAETGLMLYRNRVYHPTLGRFLQRDPIGYKADDENIYRYVNCNPLLNTDPTGNSPIALACAGACGAVVVCVAPGAIACAAESSSFEDFSACMKIYWEELPTWEKWTCGIMTVACVACIFRKVAKQILKNKCKILKLTKEGMCAAAAGAGSCTSGRGATCKCGYSSEGFTAIGALWAACSSARAAYTYTCFNNYGTKEWDGHIQEIRETATAAAKCFACAAKAT
jgi:RHS repeat-associated protein